MKRSRNKARTEIFDLMINGKPILVKATPYLVNGEETRFRVSFDGSPVHLFAWDDEEHRLRVVDNDETIPATIEMAIARQLRNKIAA